MSLSNISQFCINSYNSINSKISDLPFWVKFMSSAGVITVSGAASLYYSIAWHERVDHDLAYRRQQLTPIGFDNNGGAVVWMARHHFQMGFPFPVAMNSNLFLIRCGSGLILYNPFDISPQLKEDISQLGYDINVIVVANNGHMKFIPDAMKTYPNATVLCPPNVKEQIMKRLQSNNIHISEKQIQALSFNLVSQNEPACQPPPSLPSNQWDTDQIEYHVLRGFPFFDEIVLYHKPSRLLIAADSGCNCSRSDFCLRHRWAVPLVIRYCSYFGILNRFSVSPNFKYMVKNKEELRKSIRLISNEWMWEGMGFAHGDIISPGKVDYDIRQHWENEWENILKMVK